MSKFCSACLRTEQGFLVECEMTTGTHTTDSSNHQTICIFPLIPWKTYLNRLLNKSNTVFAVHPFQFHYIQEKMVIGWYSLI